MIKNLFGGKKAHAAAMAEAMAPVTQSIREAAKPTNKIFRVCFHLRSGSGDTTDRHVVARSEKAALLKVLEGIPEEHFSEGYHTANIFEESQAFIL